MKLLLTAFEPFNGGTENPSQLILEKIAAPEGAVAYFSTLPVWKLIAAIQRAGVSAAASYSAGTYVCNHVMYTVLYLAHKNYPKMRAGFIHVPFLPEQMEGRTAGYAMKLFDMVKGIQAAVDCMCEKETR